MKRTFLYLFFTFIISWGFMLLKYLAQNGVLPEWFTIFGSLAIIGPLLAVIIVLALEKKNIFQEIKKMFKKDTPKWTYWFVCISPFVMSFLAYLVYLLISHDSFALGVSIQMIVPIAIIIFITGGPLEEFGWRGFLLPELRGRYSFLFTVLIMGVIHGIWHIPLHFIDGTVQQAMPIWQFLIITLLTTVSYVFVYEFTKSLWPMILLHWLANFSSAMFVYWQADSGRYALFGLTIILDAILVYLYLRKKNRIKEETL